MGADNLIVWQFDTREVCERKYSMSKTVMFVLKTTANRFSFHQECTEPPCGWKMNVSSQIAQKIFSLLN